MHLIDGRIRLIMAIIAFHENDPFAVTMLLGIDNIDGNIIYSTRSLT